MNTIAHLALADFRERVRGFGFLVTVALAAFLGYQVINGFFTLRLGNYRGVYNAAWIGTLMAVTLGFFITLIGFYLVRGNVQRDRHTGVGQILAAAPLRNIDYVMGKFLSNAASLLVMVGIMALAAFIMLLIHGEDRTLDLYQLVMPFLFFSVPTALVTAAVALFFDCTPYLRHSPGNVIYFVLWLFGSPLVITGLVGMSAIERGMTVALRSQGTTYQGGIVLGALGAGELQTFLWTGFDGSTLAASRFVYVAVAVLLAALSLLTFDRFDSEGFRGSPFQGTTWTQRLAARLFTTGSARSEELPVQPRGNGLSPVSQTTSAIGLFGALVRAEIRLLLKGRSLPWYVVTAGLFLASLLTPLDGVQSWVLPAIWLWPLVLWSEMGVRETRYRVCEILFSSPFPARRQLLATWAAGVLLAMALGSGVLVRILTEPRLLPGFLAGALFIPSLALLLGVVGKAERPFQILMLIAWYLGPMNGLAPLDITAATTGALEQGIPWFYVAASPVLLALAVLARQRQLKIQ